jgi:4,5-DOPA dioxygenase extradiol
MEQPPGSVELKTRMPAVYLSHGAPTLVDDQEWMTQLESWSAELLPRPRAILVVSAHWESAPMTLGATRTVPLTYDFYGFPRTYYETRYEAPGAPDLAAAVRGLMSDGEPVADEPERGLDHGAYVPLLAMYPSADIPVLQMSMPDLDPAHLFEIGRRLAPLRDEGVLIMGSGFLTHGLPYVREYLMGKLGAPGWSRDFDQWAAESLERGDVDALFDFRNRAPGMPYAHPTVEHFAPLFVTLGAATIADAEPTFTVDGFFYGLAKRSFQID